MISNSLIRNIIRSSIWSVIGQFTSLFIMLIANIWLARLLSAREFGQLGIIMSFILVATVLTDGGLSGALIRKTNASKRDYSTIFVFNICVSIACFLLILGFSNSISAYYKDVELRLPLIVSGLIAIVDALSMIQSTRLMASMRYKRKSGYDILSVLLASIIGIICAYNSLGIWSLIILQLARSFFKTLLLWIFEKFHFKIVFSSKSFKELYKFGVFTTLASTISTIFDNIYLLIIGKVFSVTEVGYFYQAKKINDVPTGIFNSLSQGPMYAGLSKIQDNKRQFIETYSKMALYLLSLVGLITLLTVFYSDIIIVTVFGKEWANSAIYLAFLTLASFFYIQELFTRIIFKVFNQTTKLLVLECVKKSIQTISIIIGIYWKDITVLLVGFVISNGIGYTINYFISRSVLDDIKRKEFLGTYSVFISVFISLLLGFVLQKMLNINSYYSLFLTFFLVPLYFLLLKLCNVINLMKVIKLKQLIA